MTTFFTIEQVRAANEAAGQHWFSPDTMRFFGSRIASEVIRGRFFISTEQGPRDSTPRATIRMAEDDGTIETVGEFVAHETPEEARAALDAALAIGVRAVQYEEQGATFWKVQVGDFVIGSPWKDEQRARSEAQALIDGGLKAADDPQAGGQDPC
jgi:hypothetical protein